MTNVYSKCAMAALVSGTALLVGGVWTHSAEAVASGGILWAAALVLAITAIW